MILMSFSCRKTPLRIENSIKRANIQSLNKAWMSLFKLSESFLRSLALALLQIYRLGFSPYFGGNCRFEPSCSAYAVECFQKHSLHKAFYYTFRRLLSCHPGGRSGYDPVPCCSQHIHQSHQNITVEATQS